MPNRTPSASDLGHSDWHCCPTTEPASGDGDTARLLPTHPADSRGSARAPLTDSPSVPTGCRANWIRRGGVGPLFRALGQRRWINNVDYLALQTNPATVGERSESIVGGFAR